jgi:hypothetical protein
VLPATIRHRCTAHRLRAGGRSGHAAVRCGARGKNSRGCRSAGWHRRAAANASWKRQPAQHASRMFSSFQGSQAQPKHALRLLKCFPCGVSSASGRRSAPCMSRKAASAPATTAQGARAASASASATAASPARSSCAACSSSATARSSHTCTLQRPRWRPPHESQVACCEQYDQLPVELPPMPTASSCDSNGALLCKRIHNSYDGLRYSRLHTDGELLP